MRAVVLFPVVALVGCKAPEERRGDPTEPVATRDGGTVLGTTPTPPDDELQIVWADGHNDICVLLDGDIECRGVQMQESRTGPFKDFDVDHATSGCAIRLDNRLECWGDHPAAAAPPDVDVLDVAMGAFHACVLDEAGEIRCWGQGNAVLDAPTGTFVEIDAASDFTCARDAEGETRCWGLLYDDADRQPGTFGDLSVGYSLACGARANGSATCWGNGSVALPVQGVRAIHAGADYACVVMGETLECYQDDLIEGEPPEDAYVDVIGNMFTGCGWTTSDEIRCWGYAINTQGSSPTGVFEAMNAGGEASCTLDGTGSVSCWGRDYEGALAAANGAGSGWAEVTTSGFATCVADAVGNAACFGRYDDVPTVPLHGLDADSNHACGLDDLGNAHCWGSNANGQLDVPAGLGALDQIETGYINSCAIRASDGGIVCWGSPNNDALNPPAGSFVDVTAADSHFCAIEQGTNAIHCWGWNHAGQADAPAGQFLDVDADSSHTCAVDTAGALHCWGSNGYGESDPPPGTFVSVEVGSSHGCALATDGTVACWGVDDTPFD